MSNEVPLYLHPDKTLKKAATFQHAESPRGCEVDTEKKVKIMNAEPTIPRHKSPFVLHSELHKKTYFKAVEKMLITPQKPPENEKMLDPSTWGS